MSLISTHNIAYLAYESEQGDFIGSEPNIIDPNQWQHVAVTYSDTSGTVAFYINGQPGGGGNYQTNPNDSANAPLIIGNRATSDRGFQGMLSDVRIYSRTLTDDEISAIYRTYEVKENKPLAFGLSGNYVVQDGTLPAGATFTDNIFTWRPWYDQAGSYEITFEVPGQPDSTQSVPMTVEDVSLNHSYQRWLSDSQVNKGSESSFMEDGIPKLFGTSLLSNTISSDKYYTWGIDGDDLDIPEGSIITEAVLTIQGITNWDNNLHIHIVDNPPINFAANVDNGSGDFFQDFGGLLSGSSYQLVDGDLVITFSQINDENSWVWDIFDDPFIFQLVDSPDISYSSSLLELIDYANNSTPFGIGFDPDVSSYNFQAMTLDLTVESYEGQAEQSLLTFTITGRVESPLSLAHWSMDDNAPSNTVFDSSGNGNHGTAQQHTSVLHIVGQIDGALTFNGTTDYINCANVPNVLGSEKSYAFWANADSLGTLGGSIMFKNPPGTEWNGLCISQWSDGLRVYVNGRSSAASGARFAGFFSAGQWVFGVVVLEADNTVRIYKNGVLQALTVGGTYTAPSENNQDLLVGRFHYGSSNYYFDGSLDDVMVFDKALSATEVEALYNQ